MNEILIIILLVNGNLIKVTHEYTYKDHKHLARTVCLDHRNIWIDKYKNEPNTKIIYLDCPNWWSET